MNDRGPMPSRKQLFEDSQQPAQNKEYSPEHAKTILESSTLKAIQVFAQVIDDPESSPNERLAAAKAIIELGHGKNTEHLRIVKDTQDVATLIAEAIQNARTPKPNNATDTGL